MFKRIKALEKQVEELEKAVAYLIKEKEEQEFKQPPVMGARKG